MKTVFRKAAVLAAFSSYLLPLQAAAANSELDVSGFATLAYGKTFSDKEEGTVSSIPQEGEYRDFNKFGLRLDADLEDNLTFTAQIVANGVNDYEPNVDWLFVTYNFMPTLSLSVGKVRMPLYMYSDYLDVSYAYQWISPPQSVYGVPSISSTEGVKLAWTADMGGQWTSEMLLWTGKTQEFEAALGSDLIIENGVGFAWAIERDWLTLRAVYFGGKATADTSAATADLFDGLALIEGNVQQQTADPSYSLNGVREDFEFVEDDAVFMGLGAFMDFEYAFFGAEATMITMDKNVAVGDLKSYYAMAGVRLPGDWSVSLTYSVNDDKANEEVYEDFQTITADHAAIPLFAPDADGNMAPYMLNDTTQATVAHIVQGTVTGIEAQTYEESQTYTLGARWDFHRSAAFKMEYLHQIRDGMNGNTAEISTTDADAFRVALDLVF
ncbi:MAG: hypothetical protein HRU20_15915 [Pseudomonadales bacterium]|nr:hypothetical protein [Pseudomonadales bacterium]